MLSTVLTNTFRILFSAILFITFAAFPAPAAADEQTPDDQPPQIGDPYQEEQNLQFETQPEVQPAFAGCGRADTPALNAAFEQRVLELVNQRRAEAGLPPVKRNAQLDLAARYQAKDMMDEDYISHDTMDRQGGSLVTACSFSQRLNNYYPVWDYRAENIAAAQTTPETVMVSWMGSTGHRANILSSNVREIGIGFMQPGGSYGRYWVQDFGRSPNVYPVIINQEFATTNTAQVSLFIYGQGAWNEMRLRNDSEAWTNWQTFRQSFTWSLPPAPGLHTISVELRKTGGTTGAASSDTIFLNGNLPYRTFLSTIRR